MLVIYNENIVKVHTFPTNQWMCNYAKPAKYWQYIVESPQAEEMDVPVMAMEDLWEDVILEQECELCDWRVE